MTSEELAALWADRFGEDAVISESFSELTVDVPVARWVEALKVFGLVEMTIFIVILALGLLYAWRKRVLRWV